VTQSALCQFKKDLARFFATSFLRTSMAMWIACIGIGICLPQLSAHADNLVTLKTGTLGFSPENGSVGTLATLDGRLLVLGKDASWVLDESELSWRKDDWHPQQPIRAVALDKLHAYVLLGSDSDEMTQLVDKLIFKSGKLGSQHMPSLPVPLLDLQAAMVGAVLHVVGNDGVGTFTHFSMDTRSEQLYWTALHETHFKGKPTSLIGQRSALYATVRSASGDGDRLWQWTPSSGWVEKKSLSGTVIQRAARPTGQAHVVYLVDALTTLPFTPSMMMYHTITGSWATLDDPKALGAIDGAAWRNGIAWRHIGSTGTVEIDFAEIESGKLLLTWLDWVVIIFYLTSMLGMGLYFYLREKRTSTADFFVGGRSIPYWAAGISLYAANTSSISYIAIPAKAFETNWQYLTNNLIAVLGLMFVAIWIVPVLRRLNLMSSFQYLESRFHPVIRTLASALFIAVQIGSRMSIILFLPSLAIATMTGIDVIWSILIMGVFTMIYTALGGMKAVVWTDVVQLVVKMGGIFFTIGFVIYMLDGGVGELIKIAQAEEKTKLFDFSWDLTKATVWGFLFLVLFDVVLTFPKDQVLMQRVLSTRSDKDAARSVWMFAAIMIPGGFLFYGVGTALYVYYKNHPERMNPLLTIDATFPLFIAAELPMGIRGLIVAGILAAAMATLSSIMNSVATLASVDFYEKWAKNPTPKSSVHFAEAMTVVTGILGMGVALLLTRYDIHSLFDTSIELAGLLGGGFAGAYSLGMFTRRANWQGVAIGVTVSISMTTIAWSMNLVHPYFYLAISIFICIVVGYAASWLFPPPLPNSLEGLTIYS
jgi:SSS family solute:Na+ symporter